MGSSAQSAKINLRKSLRYKPSTDQTGIIASLPRRELIQIEPADVTPPMMQSLTFSPDFTQVLRSFFKWWFAGFSIFAGNFLDQLRRKDSEARRASRMRHRFENTGGTFRKIGQLLAMRIDILPWAYCVELSHVIDQMHPFPVEQAIEVMLKGENEQPIRLETQRAGARQLCDALEKVGRDFSRPYRRL